jgi:hypothetical protein
MRMIVLKDLDDPGQSMDAILLRRESLSVSLRVPGTTVFFSLRRSEGESWYTGFIGGRRFYWEDDNDTHDSPSAPT